MSATVDASTFGRLIRASRKSDYKTKQTALSALNSATESDNNNTKTDANSSKLETTNSLIMDTEHSDDLDSSANMRYNHKENKLIKEKAPVSRKGSFFLLNLIFWFYTIVFGIE